MKNRCDVFLIALFAAFPIFAQTALVDAPIEAPVTLGLPADPFAVAYEQAVAEYRATIDFSGPAVATKTLAPGGAGEAAPKAPYSLEGLLALAAAGNPGLKAAAESEAAARADFNGARARRLPTLKAETSGSFIGNPLGAITLTAGQLGEFQGVAIPPQDVIVYKGMESYNYDFALIGDVPLYTWGKISLGIDLARTGLAAAGLQRRKAEHELAVKMRGSWDALACIQKAAGIVVLQAEIGTRLVELSERSEAAGFLTKADLASARIKLKEIDIAAARLDERRDRLLSELASMAGLRSLAMTDLRLELPAAGSPRWSEDEVYELALEGSYDLALMATLLEAKRGLRDMAEKEARGLPDIGLHVKLSYGGSRFPFIETDWFGQDDYQLTFSLGTSGNIFGSAVKAGEAAKARAQLSEAEAQKADAERSVRAFVRETYLGLDLGKARLEYAALKQDGWASDLAQMRATIQAGGGSEAEYLTKMIEALGGLAEAYGTLAEYRGALVSLDAVTGDTSAN